MKEERLTIEVLDGKHTVGGLLMVPETIKAFMVLGHGAGAGMTHPFMKQLAMDLSEQHIASLRYNFTYMEEGRGSPGSPTVSEATVRAAVEKANQLKVHKNLIAGGKSYGGRMTSQAQSKEPLAGVRGLVFFGFPLHAPGRPGDQRGEHLKEVNIPMLFLQGTRDKLADIELMRPLCQSLGQKARLEIMEGADHGFNMLKSGPKTKEEVRLELALHTSKWAQKL